MTRDEAMQHGLGYAAAREDASGVKTLPSPEAPGRPGFMAFADEYAQGWDDYNAERRHYMTNARDAYDTWQKTRGETIFRS
jgi:hypothetical protein